MVTVASNPVDRETLVKKLRAMIKAASGKRITMRKSGRQPPG